MHKIAAGLCFLLTSTALGHAAPRTDLSAAQLRAPAAEAGTEAATETRLVENAAFVAPEGAAAASDGFEGTLHLGETLMTTEPAKLKSDNLLGKDPAYFPKIAISFTTVNGNLVPLTQDVIRAGSLPEGKSFWDTIVQPGAVWSEPGDDGWNRASFPFALMHSIEGETHNGVATFLYKGSEVSAVRMQIVNQTAPFYVEDRFTAAATLPASFSPEVTGDAKAARQTFEAAEKDAYPTAPWSEFVAKYGQEVADGFDGTIGADERVAAAITVDGTMYVKYCPTPMGELPYCARQRFGVWSVTKAATNEMAMLSLAQKFGAGIYDQKLVELIPEAKGLEGWDRVTLGNLVNMSSAMGYGSHQAKPYTVSDPFDDHYYAWYEAPTTADKLAVLLPAAKPYPWLPGEVIRYRDEDMFLLGVGLTRVVQKHGYANVWDYLEKEVYGPIGIHYAPTNKTIESEPSKDQSLMAYGYYPTLGDMAKLAELIHQDGKFGGKQILSAEKVKELQPREGHIGLPTGERERPYYHEAFWYSQMDSKWGCALYYPAMTGFGANYVAIFPKDITTIRIAKNLDNTRPSRTMDNFEETADAIADLCE
ncbi:serine hydrolase [Paracoccus aminophilus]|uniref:Beta-lactamase-related domain-containing protein n=1 Tax=Paracoccus aminophilus JCM 7686 TaxID=1367847 RepID=S5Z0D3_PARAH|nr:serine hydrolase [Paracoccus aminophilus]AGT10926.1 hypothetical protein JCM7686_pAMI4p236 [Paracoccus aminophilus JCM 7686]